MRNPPGQTLSSLNGPAAGSRDASPEVNWNIPSGQTKGEGLT